MIKNFIKENKKQILLFIMGGIFFGGISVVAADLIESSEVSYTPPSGVSAQYVDAALDDLYTRSSTIITNLQNQNDILQSQFNAAPTQEQLTAALTSCGCVKKVETDKENPTEYDINGEKFIVIWSNIYETALISKYNLLVGNECSGSGAYIECEELSSPTGKQDKNALGYRGSFPSIGVLKFSTVSYWSSSGKLAPDYTINGASLSGNPYPYVYNSTNSLYTYLVSYTRYLNSSNSSIVKAVGRLATYEELNNLGCKNSSTCPEWIKNTSFWTGSTDSVSGLWTLDYSGNLQRVNYTSQRYYGIRPVIIVNTADL